LLKTHYNRKGGKQMVRRIAGITGISLWTALIVVAGLSGFEAKADGEEMFKNLPEGWKVENSFIVPQAQVMAFSRKFGARLSRVSNTFLSVNGQPLQINIVHCHTAKGAEKVYKTMLEGHRGLAVSVARSGNSVIEFAKCDDVNLLTKARRTLGLPDVQHDNRTEEPATEELFGNLPPGWKLKKSFLAPEDQTAAIGKKLGGHIIKLSNTVLSVHGNELRVNTLNCPTPQDAENIQNSILAMKDHPAFCLLQNKSVVEFVCDNVNLAIKAAWELGLKPKPAEATYRITFDAAPVKKGDFMSWNKLFNLFAVLNKYPDSNNITSQIADLLKRFEFGNEISLRTCGNEKAKPAYRFKPDAIKVEVAGHGDITKYTFKNMPRKLEVPYVSVEATVTTRQGGFMPGRRKASDELLRPTEFWPVDDPEIRALTNNITAGKQSQQDKVKAILEWFAPGKNISFAGPVEGSRYGVKKVLEQGFGHCWDFSDSFVTLCRASGIPCRQVGGWLYGASGHIWAEVLFEGKGWQQVDPTGGGREAGESGIYYIPYLTSEDGSMSVLFLSIPKIEFVD